MKLRELVDLDSLLLRSARSGEGIARRLPRPPGGAPSAGDVALRSLRLGAVLLGVVGVLAGWNAAAVALHYDGTQPINIMVYFTVLILPQILWLPFIVIAFFPSFVARLPVWNSLHGLIGRLLAWTARLAARTFGGPGQEPRRQARDEFDRLRLEGALFSRVYPVLLLLLGQIFGVAFNLGAASSLLGRVIFSDLAFSWSTTIRLDTETVHQILAWVSAPWAWALPQAQPSLELVEATRYIRMDGAFVAATDQASLLAGEWWRFLLAGTVFYGLLPRVLALAGGRLLLGYRIRRAVALSSRVRALRESLRVPLVETAGEPEPEPEPALERAPATGRAPRWEIAGSTPPELKVAAIAWAYDAQPDADQMRALLDKLQLGSLVLHETAGQASGTDEPVFERIAADAEAGKVNAAAVLVEPFEPPKADIKEFLSGLRQRLGPAAPIVIILAEFEDRTIRGASETDRQIWERAIGRLGDPLLLMGGGGPS